ncbi:MAG: hypothetical protein WC644_06275 [Ignavibacteria bacterium]
MAKSIIGILSVFFSFFLIADSYSQVDTRSLPKNNFALFSDLSSKGLDELQDIVTVLGKNKIFKISIDEKSEEAEFLLNNIKQKFSSYNFIYGKEDGFDYKVIISSIKFSVGYSEPDADKIIGDEMFVRDLSSAFKFSVLNSGNDQQSVLKTYRDEVKIEYFDYIQESNYGFMKSGLPDKPFLKKIIVPAIIVAVSAIAAILFFTIRSK